MTVTEAPRDAAVEAAAAPSPSAPPTGLAAVVGTGDPRIVGKLFVGTSLLFLLVSGVAGALVGVEQFDSASSDIFGADTALRVFTLHSTTALFLGVLPLFVGLATAVVPLQVGASTVAFPRASAAAFWTWLVSGALVLAAYGFDGGPFGTDADMVGLYVAGVIATVIALVVATVSVVTTVITLRAPGMSLRRTPLFSWSVLVAGSVWLLTLPVLAGVLLLAYLDLRYGQQFLGGSSGLYDRVAWLFWQPTLYVFAVPALGVIADVVPVFARRRHQRHSAAMVLIGLAGALGFGAWAQLGASVDGSANPAPWLDEGPWIVVGVLAVVPVLGLLGLWTLTLLTGRVRLGTPLVVALFSGLLLLTGIGGGVATVIDGLDLTGTTWMTAQADLVLLGAALGGLAGVAFWAPKLYGRLLPDVLTRLGATLVAVGAFVAAVPQAIAGLAYDQARFVAGGVGAVDPGDLETVETLDLVSAVGLAVVVLGGLAVAGALVARRRVDGPGDDPWTGHTLEWTTSSPPPVGNFATLPAITSEAPLYDARYAPANEGTEASA
ncbi:MAG TPA: cbb3-type cytochrome c oxidase subunit I [Acidimicrobiales bacterium]|nr:cbb3-type cytochrome c oxidase subunit I [Acidimicrobiales bacterium]